MCEKKYDNNKKYTANDCYYDNFKMQHFCPMMMPMHQMMQAHKGCPMMSDEIMYYNSMPMCQMNYMPMHQYSMPMHQYSMPMHYMPMQPVNYYQGPQLDEPMIELGEIGIKDWYEEYESDDSSEDNMNSESEDIHLGKTKKKHSLEHKNTCCHWPPYYHTGPYRSEEYYEDEE